MQESYVGALIMLLAGAMVAYTLGTLWVELVTRLPWFREEEEDEVDVGEASTMGGVK